MRRRYFWPHAISIYGVNHLDMVVLILWPNICESKVKCFLFCIGCILWKVLNQDNEESSYLQFRNSMKLLFFLVVVSCLQMKHVF